ncbi:MAG TPA: hypothetical protein VKY19_25850 [Ktedonosporobacter sp.]|jgi:hypothetical protein|nr:hypothetical protein [Ktedonosporobacter sp.]
MQLSESSEHASQRRICDASVYSTCVQEAMRYDRLSSADYALVMTLLDVVLQGYSEERWKTEQQRLLKGLTEQSPDKSVPHADATNRYEQVVRRLQDLALWPW